MDKTKIINWGYKTIILLSLPAALWTGLEMYLVTLFSPQMLFYSLSHGLPIFIAIFSFSGIFFMALILVNFILLVLNPFKTNIGLPIRIVSLIIVFQLVHMGLVFTYEAWSSVSVMRVIVSIMGLSFMAYVLLIGFKVLYTPNKSLQPTTESGG